MSFHNLLEVHRSGKYATVPVDKLDTLYVQTKAALSTQMSDFERYTLLELQFYITLTMGLDIEAKACLDLICDRFEISKSERVSILKNVYIEATTDKTPEMLRQDVIKDANDIVKISNIAKTTMGGKFSIAQDLMGITKRVVSLHRDDPKEYADKLTTFLDLQPLDTETWYELSEVYFKTGNHEQAIYCLNEILLIEPCAYNIFCRIGEIELVTAFNTNNKQKFEDAKKHFARSCELCETYHRGWLGLLASSKETGDDKMFALSKSQLEKIASQRMTNQENVESIYKVLAKY